MLENKKNRWNILISLILILAISLCGLLYAKEISNKVSEQNKVHIEEVSEQISNNISSKIEEYVHELKLISDNIVINPNISIEDKQKVLQYEIEECIFNEIVIVDSEGKGITSTGEPIFIGDKDYLKKILNGKASIEKPVKSRVKDKNVVICSAPMVYEDNVVGAIFGIINSDLVKDNLLVNAYSNEGCAYIISKKGEILFSKHNGQENKNIDESDVFEYPLDTIINNKNKHLNEKGASIGYLHGENKYLGYSKIDSAEDWYLVTAIPMGEIFINTESTIKVTIILLISFILIFIIISAYIINTNYTNEKKIAKAIYEDHLTEISNYDKFLIDAQNYLRTKEETDCIMISFDIQKFKLINDIYGYQAGDQILKGISTNLKKYFGKGAVYGRLTNDVFGLLIALENETNKIQELVNIIKKEIIDVSNIEGFNINIDVSIGIYIIEDKDKLVQKIVDNADMARLKAKYIDYKEYAVFDTHMLEEKKLLMQIEQDLLSALENRQFNIYYQPKFDLITGKMVGSEALIRWIHPTMGIVKPSIFIPITEKNGFINEIGRWVFNEVCKTLSSMINEGIDVVPVSVNLSRIELYQDDLVDFFKRTLKLYDVPPELIEIEITETTALNDIRFVNDKLIEIKSLGIKVAMDDFGIGNSNFSNLKNVPVDILKIDRSLLLDIESNFKTKVVVESIIALSKCLELEVICEGVENVDQVEILKEIGCYIIQGYVFSKAIDINEYKKLLKHKESNL